MRKGIHSLVWNMTRRCAAHWNWPVRPQPLVTYRLVRWCWMRPARLSGADTTRVRLMATRIGTIAFGAWDPKLGACGSIWDIPRDPHIGHSPEVHGGVLEGECQSILTDFFAQRR